MAMHGPATGGASHNFTSLQRNVTAQRRFHAPSYHQPRGWYSHRWTFGETLPALFWTQNYWIGDYYDYGLPPPPPGTIWVRDGSDALLIDQGDGEIIQVDYGVFY
jgi:Ni/Co efflux regulator RcnB